jgi:DNA topoisomerase IB
MGEAFTAKDFRTWGGTLAAIEKLAAIPLPEDASERALSTIEKQVATEVAQLLGNTPSVCRKAYIDPSVFAAWRAGRLLALGASPRNARAWERAALTFLRAARREAARASRPARKARGIARKPRRASATDRATTRTPRRGRSVRAPAAEAAASP